MRNKSTYSQLSSCDMCVVKKAGSRIRKEIVNKEMVMTKEREQRRDEQNNGSPRVRAHTFAV